MLHTKSYRIVASEVPFDSENRDIVFNTFFVVSDFFKKNPIAGACHLYSSYLYILMKEQQVNAELCIGEVQQSNGFFDHSWVEIDQKVFDVAIQKTLDETINAPVFANFDLGTGAETNRYYGSQSPMGLAMVGEQVFKMPLGKYLNNAPLNAWKTIKKLGKELSLNLDEKELQQKYKGKKRTLITNRQPILSALDAYNMDDPTNDEF